MCVLLLNIKTQIKNKKILFYSILVLNNILETEPCYRKYLFYEPCTVLFLKWRPRPHLCVFFFFFLHFDKFRPSVHTNMLSVSIENASVWKMHLRSGAKRIHICIVWVWMVENSQKRIKMKSMTKKYHSMVIEFNLCHNAQLYHFQTLKCGQSKMHDQNSSVDANWSMCFWRQQKCILFKMY